VFTPGEPKNCLIAVEIDPTTFWFARSMLYQLSYEIKVSSACPVWKSPEFITSTSRCTLDACSPNYNRDKNANEANRSKPTKQILYRLNQTGL
jgi:hypothetical protein